MLSGAYTLAVSYLSESKAHVGTASRRYSRGVREPAGDGTFALHNRSRPPLSTLDVRFEDTPADFVVWTSPAFVDTSQSASSEADLGSRYRSLANDGNWAR